MLMNNKERMKEIISQLKQIKYERELSVQAIHEMVSSAGFYTSPSTIRRVFADGSEEQNFRYQDTIQPIVQVLIGVKEEGEPLGVAEADALKNVALLKDSFIRELQKENEAMRLKLEQLEHELAIITDRVEFLKDQIARKDSYIDRLAKKAGI